MIDKSAFVGQTAVVTGGTRGIGAGIVRAFLEHGARVVATYQGNESAADELRSQCAAHGDRLELARFDVADAAGVTSFWEALDARSPDGVQVLVNNAGIRRDAIVGSMSAADWQRVIDVNLTGSFLMAKQAVLAMMRRRYGRIVFVTSPSAGHGFQGQAAYGASKAGQHGLMRSLAREVAKRKITVNCVSPGFVDTELLADLTPEAKAEHLAMVPLQRFAEVREVAYAVLALCSRDASYVHGATLEVTGGL